MEGVMSPLFCATAAALDLLPEMITPFLRISQDIPRIGKIRKWLKPLIIQGKPLTVQLMGDSPENLLKAAKLLRAEGVASFNLNFACPSGQVIRSGAGGALLKNPGQMRRIASVIRESMPDTALSVKLRIGFLSPAEYSDIAAAFEGLNLNFMAVHFRTVSEGYRKITDGLDRIRNAVLKSPAPVIGNGDIMTVADAQLMLKETGCAGVMCARGLLRDPFLLRRLKEQEAPAAEVGRRIFYRNALEIAESAPEKYWSRPQLIELARFIWGVSSPEFQRIIKLHEFSVETVRKACVNLPD